MAIEIILIPKGQRRRAHASSPAPLAMSISGWKTQRRNFFKRRRPPCCLSFFFPFVLCFQLFLISHIPCSFSHFNFFKYSHHCFYISHHIANLPIVLAGLHFDKYGQLWDTIGSIWLVPTKLVFIFCYFRANLIKI